jgi:sec-independent protein translocase protein TatA
MGSLSPIHWLLVIIVLLLVFGPTRLAGAGKGLGEGIRAFKKGLSEDDEKAAEEKKAEKSEEPKVIEAPAADKVPPKADEPKSA